MLQRCLGPIMRASATMLVPSSAGSRRIRSAIGAWVMNRIWFASESMTQIAVSPHLRRFRLDQERVLDDRAGTFSRQQWRPLAETVSVVVAEA